MKAIYDNIIHLDNIKRSKMTAMKTNVIPRPEYPRPQFVRKEWINLNGTWTFEFDSGKSGHERELMKSCGFKNKIIVPFCPESKLSGVEHKDFIEMIWYHKKINIPAEWNGKLLMLNFGGVDYECEAYINGKLAGRHFGGSSSFSFDITSLVIPGGEHELTVMAKDNTRSGNQPGGKQSPEYKSHGCVYTRTTGIWQTVWLEAVDRDALKSCRIIPDFDNGSFCFIPAFYSVKQGNKLMVEVSDGKKTVQSEVFANDAVPFTIKLENPYEWSPENPFLYDIKFFVKDSSGKIIDEVEAYAGLRKIHIEGNRMFLNNKPLYLRHVLDQGFYPDGIWTAPSDEALKKDIELSMKAGFNGARLHQKVFEERFHYWADRLGYLTWAEYSSWGISLWKHGTGRNSEASVWNTLSEWKSVVERDINHPSIIAWTPLNETCGATDWVMHRRFHEDIYNLTKSIDPSRPVNEASGYVHQITDLWTVHYYEQDPAKYKEMISTLKDSFNADSKNGVAYGGQPYFIDEMGGTKWIPENQKAFADNTWGYGNGPKTEEEFYSRLKGVIDAILSEKYISGYCYTQLTDVEQEQNGIYNYDRSEKFDMCIISGIFSKKVN